MTLYIGIGITILFTIFILVLYNNSVKCHIKSIKVEEANDNSKILLEKKLDTMIKLQKELNKNTDEKLLENIQKIKKKELDVFELDKELIKSFKEFKINIEDNKIKLEDSDKKLIEEINNTDIVLYGVKQYYNAVTNDYNKAIKGIGNKLIKIFKHYKTKELFIIEKEEDFEILKKK